MIPRFPARVASRDFRCLTLEAECESSRFQSGRFHFPYNFPCETDSLVKPGVSTFSASQDQPGLCGRWSQNLHVCEVEMAAVRLLRLLGPKFSRFGVQGGHMSPNVPKCPQMSPNVAKCPQMSPNVPKCRPIFFSRRGVSGAGIGGILGEYRAESGGWNCMTSTE